MPCARSVRSSRRYPAKPPGVWRLSIRTGSSLTFRNQWTTFGGARTYVPGVPCTTSSPTWNSTSPSRTKNESECRLCRCGSTPLPGSNGTSRSESPGRAALTPPGPQRDRPLRDRLAHSDRLLDEVQPVVGVHGRHEHPLLHHATHPG